MKQIVAKNKAFLLPLTLLLLLLTPFICIYDKGAFSLWLNARHNPIFDFFFRYITWLGDGVCITILCIIFMFFNLRNAIIVSLVSIFSALMVSVIKNMIREPRPVVYFKEMQLHYVDGLHMYHGMSFPSGHTAGAFTFFFVCAILTNSNVRKMLFLIPPVLVAISRVYLLQHFLIDVWAGAICGILFTLLLTPIIRSFAEKRIPPDLSLAKFFRNAVSGK